MGASQAEAFAQEVAEGNLDLAAALTYHLTANHYPPVPVSMVPICIEAIEAWNDGREADLVALPPGITWRGQDAAPAEFIIEGHHLQSFLG